MGSMERILCNHLVEHLLAVVFEHGHQVVAGAAEAVQGSFADAGGLGQFLERGARVDHDGVGQGLEQAFIVGSGGHRHASRGVAGQLLCRK